MVLYMIRIGVQGLIGHGIAVEAMGELNSTRASILMIYIYIYDERRTPYAAVPRESEAFVVFVLGHWRTILSDPSSGRPRPVSCR